MSLLHKHSSSDEKTMRTGIIVAIAVIVITGFVSIIGTYSTTSLQGQLVGRPGSMLNNLKQSSGHSRSPGPVMKVMRPTTTKLVTPKKY